MTDTETKPFGGYGFAIRTFWTKGADLAVSRRWERESRSEPDAGDRFELPVAQRGDALRG